MRPIPPCADLEDESWKKVDDLLKKTLDVMKSRGVERSMNVLSEALFDMAAADAKLDVAIQTTAYRALDTRLLAGEYGRLRRAEQEMADGKKGDLASLLPPELWMVPPSVGHDVDGENGLRWSKRENYEVAYRVGKPPILRLLQTIADKLRRRGILGGKGG